ncbi:MAG: hypothetical protein IJE74_07750 [Clostridia bacterium]|nr:hypothetical protein [Clostridia bacterium]
MIDKNIEEYVRLVRNITMPSADREHIAEILIEKAPLRKEFSMNYVAAASVAVLVALSVCIPFVRRSKM